MTSLIDVIKYIDRNLNEPLKTIYANVMSRFKLDKAAVDLAVDICLNFYHPPGIEELISYFLDRGKIVTLARFDSTISGRLIDTTPHTLNVVDDKCRIDPAWEFYYHDDVQDIEIASNGQIRLHLKPLEDVYEPYNTIRIIDNNEQSESVIAFSPGECLGDVLEADSLSHVKAGARVRLWLPSRDSYANVDETIPLMKGDIFRVEVLVKDEKKRIIRTPEGTTVLIDDEPSPEGDRLKEEMEEWLSQDRSMTPEC